MYQDWPQESTETKGLGLPIPGPPFFKESIDLFSLPSKLYVTLFWALTRTSYRFCFLFRVGYFKLIAGNSAGTVHGFIIWTVPVISSQRVPWLYLVMPVSLENSQIPGCLSISFFLAVFPPWTLPLNFSWGGGGIWSLYSLLFRTLGMAPYLSFLIHSSKFNLVFLLQTALNDILILHEATLG